MRRITFCLNKQLIDICQGAIHLDDLNAKLRQLLPENLRNHCSVGSFSKGCLVIVTTDATQASILRYHLPNLRDALRTSAGLYQLLSIKTQIAADLYTSKKKASALVKKPELSTTARQALQEAGDSCTYPPLQQILHRISNNTSEGK